MPSVTSATSNAHKALEHRNIKSTMERRADLVFGRARPWTAGDGRKSLRADQATKMNLRDRANGLTCERTRTHGGSFNRVNTRKMYTANEQGGVSLRLYARNNW